MRKVKLFLMLWMFLGCLSLTAQEKHWNCNIYQYQYDMTVFLRIRLGNEILLPSHDYEVAAFCGEECRGVAEWEEGTGYYYLRVRSNKSGGEKISFKCYSRKEGEEILMEDSLDFKQLNVVGMPSSPWILNEKAPLYRLTFYLDGEEWKSLELKEGDIIRYPEVPGKEGHTFEGWDVTPEVMPAQQVTVNGTYKRNAYKLIYYLNDRVYEEEEVLYGDTIVLKPYEPKEGEVFSGWSEVPEVMPAHEVRVYGNLLVSAIQEMAADCMVVDVYSLEGVLVRKQVRMQDLKRILAKGLYIIQGKVMRL